LFGNLPTRFIRFFRKSKCQVLQRNLPAIAYDTESHKPQKSGKQQHYGIGHQLHRRFDGAKNEIFQIIFVILFQHFASPLFLCEIALKNTAARRKIKSNLIIFVLISSRLRRKLALFAVMY
jgi:hypothetical protein